ncbi:unnamed protein product, partial [Vitis vinifera]
MGLLACNVPRIKYRVKLEKIDSRLNSDLGWPNYVNTRVVAPVSASVSAEDSRLVENEERVASSDAMDILCYSERQADACYDD